MKGKKEEVKIFIRIYKNMQDIDLFGLCCNGYNLGRYIKKILVNYANGIDSKVILEKDEQFREYKKKYFKFILQIDDEKTIELLKELKFRSRNSFCKALFRSCMVTNNFSAYFKDGSAPTEDLLKLKNLDFYESLKVQKEKRDLINDKENLFKSLGSDVDIIFLTKKNEKPTSLKTKKKGEKKEEVKKATKNEKQNKMFQNEKKETIKETTKVFEKNNNTNISVSENVNENANINKNVSEKISEKENESKITNDNNKKEILLNNFADDSSSDNDWEDNWDDWENENKNEEDIKEESDTDSMDEEQQNATAMLLKNLLA